MLGLAGSFVGSTAVISSAKPVGLIETALAVDAAAKALCAGLSDKELSWRPRPEKWSVAENLAHLRITTEIFLPVVDSALEATKIMGLRSDGPFALGPFGRLVVWRLGARPMIKMRAPQVLQPRLQSSPGSELNLFLNSQTAFRQRIDEADGLSLTAWRFPSPVTSHFRVNLLEFFSALNAHSWRHLWQATKVRQAMLPTAGPSRTMPL